MNDQTPMPAKEFTSGQSRLTVGLAADLRTRSGQEASVIEQIREYGGFSIFWATETQRRACAIERLQKRGEISRIGGSYPFCKYELAHNVQIEAPPASGRSLSNAGLCVKT